MANNHQPNDPRNTAPRHPHGNDAARLNGDLQADTTMQQGRASGGRMLAYGVVALVLLGVVFYGLNSSPTDQNGAASTAQSTSATKDGAQKAPTPTNNIADNNTKPPVAPGVRDVTPTKQNSDVTTGSAPIRSQGPQSNPTGTEIDSSKTGTAR
jgi:hypothetical protein